MKIEIEFTSEQIQRVLDATQEMFDTLERKIRHLKGRVRRLEENLDYLLNRVKTLEGSRTA